MKSYIGLFYLALRYGMQKNAHNVPRLVHTERATKNDCWRRHSRLLRVDQRSRWRCTRRHACFQAASVR